MTTPEEHRIPVTRDPDHIALLEKLVAGTVHGLTHGRDTADMLAEIHDAAELALGDVRIDFDIFPDQQGPTEAQLSIAFAKYIHGITPGHESWCDLDQEAFDWATRSTPSQPIPDTEDTPPK